MAGITTIGYWISGYTEIEGGLVIITKQQNFYYFIYMSDKIVPQLIYLILNICAQNVHYTLMIELQ